MFILTSMHLIRSYDSYSRHIKCVLWQTAAEPQISNFNDLFEMPQNETFGALGETRTPMTLRSVDFESTASTDSATRAHMKRNFS